LINLKKCKRILRQNGENYSDEQVKKIRQFLYQMAELDYKLFKQNQVNEKCNNLYQSKYG